MRQVGGDQTLEFGDELMRALGRQVQFEEFDGDEPLASRVIGTKDRS